MNPYAAAGADIGGSVISGMFGASEAREQRQFIRKMDNTKYQRAAADLEAAGLNRILGLQGASAPPAGSIPSMPASRPGTTAVMAASAKQQIEMQKAQTNLINEQARIAGAQADKEEITKSPYELLLPVVESVIEGLKSLGSSASALDPKKLIEGFKDEVQSGAGAIADEVKKGPSKVRDQSSMYIGDKIDEMVDWFDSFLKPENRRHRHLEDFKKKK